MKILLLEFSPAEGHKRLFLNTCELLAQQSKLFVVAADGYALPENISTIYRVNNKTVRSKNRYIQVLNKIIDSIRRMRLAVKLDCQENFDAIICVTYNEWAYYIGHFLLGDEQKKIFLMQHNNIDNAERSRIKKWMMQKYAPKVRHIVQCQYVADYLAREYKIPEVHIIQWLHPMNANDTALTPKEEAIDCVGISNSNDENVIRELIRKEKSKRIFAKNQIKVLLRSREEEYDDGYLKVIKGYLSKEKYDSYICAAKCIFLPFPESFVYRMSGTIVDAFSNRKPIIGTNILLIRQCEKAYPNICRPFSPDTFCTEIAELTVGSPKQEEDFAQFCRIHAEEHLKSTMARQLEASMKEEKFKIETDF